MINDFFLTWSAPQMHNELATHQPHDKDVSNEPDIESSPQPSKTSSQDTTPNTARLRAKLVIWNATNSQDNSRVGAFDPGHWIHRWKDIASHPSERRESTTNRNRMTRTEHEELNYYGTLNR